MLETSTVEVKKISGSKQIAAAIKNREALPLGLDTPANEIVAYLKSQGVEVTVQLVNNVKFRIRKLKEEKKAAKGTAQPKLRRGRRPLVPVETVVSPVQSEFDQMVAVKKLATEFGGLDNLSKLIDKVRLLAG